MATLPQGVAGYSHIFKTASTKLTTTTFNHVKTTSFQNFTGVSQPTDPTYTYNQLISHGVRTCARNHSISLSPSGCCSGYLPTGPPALAASLGVRHLPSHAFIQHAQLTLWFSDWDACTSTPFLFNSKTRIFIAYDDVQSTGLKAQWVKTKGLAGVVSSHLLPSI